MPISVHEFVYCNISDASLSGKEFCCVLQYIF